MNQPPGQSEPADHNEAGDNESKLVFISHTHDDDGLKWSLRVKEELAATLGLKVWLDTQHLMSGDSIQQEVFGWLGRCTDFVGIVTKNYFSSQYCREEAEQAYNRKIQEGTGFHLLRFGVPIEAVPARYSGIYSLDFSEKFEDTTQQLADAIKGTREEPQQAVSSPPGTGRYASYSAESMQLAKFYCEHTINAVGHEMIQKLEELPSQAGMTADGLAAALEQLNHFFIFGFLDTIYPSDSLWVVIPTNQLRPSETRGRSADLCLCPRQPNACWAVRSLCKPA